MKYVFILYFIIIFLLAPFQASPFFGSTEEKNPTLMIESLQKQQVDDPNNPWINYNLGVAFYKAGKFADAHNSFERALPACTDQKLKTNCLFNLGNSLYKETLATLPRNYEIEDIDQALLEQTINSIKKAIQQYQKILTLDKNNIQAKANHKKLLDLLEKLEKKQKLQPKKQWQQDKQGTSLPSSNQKKDETTEQNKENQQQKQGKKGTDNAHQESDQGSDNKFNNQNQKDHSQQHTQGNGHEQPRKDQEKLNKDQQPYGTQPSEQKQEIEKGHDNTSAANASASREMQNLTAMLNNLQADESKTQKALITQTLRNKMQPQQSTQKPW